MQQKNNIIKLKFKNKQNMNVLVQILLIVMNIYWKMMI